MACGCLVLWFSLKNDRRKEMANANKKEVAKNSGKDVAAIKKTEPESALSRFEEFERMFDDFFPRHWMRPLSFDRPSWIHLPAPFEGRSQHVEVVDRDKEVYINAELPGVGKDELETTMTGNAVTI